MRHHGADLNPEDQGAFAALADRLGRTRTWAAFLLIFLPFGSLSLALRAKAWHGLSPGQALGVLLTPALFVAAFIWLSPFPWQVGRRDGAPLPLWRGVPQAIAFCLVAMMGLHALDVLVLRASGVMTTYSTNLESELFINAPAMVLVGLVLAAREQADVDNARIQLEARLAQTRLLQSQLHPHVLFNALNGLAELIHKDADAAEESVRRMSALLRNILRASRRDAFTLDEERSLVEDYLHLEGLRLGPRLRVAWVWDEALNGQRVPPLIIQPLVENAIKHGISTCRTGGDLVVTARRAGGVLDLEVRNTGSALVQGLAGQGIGVENLRRRLQLAYGEAAQLSLGTEGAWTVAGIRIAEPTSRGLA
ncbi:MAG: histidine kinase [Holophagaceae bacterium]|nr:histidine kinase [Holophagaceae bacterium]